MKFAGLQRKQSLQNLALHEIYFHLSRSHAGRAGRWQPASPPLPILGPSLRKFERVYRIHSDRGLFESHNINIFKSISLDCHCVVCS